MTESEHDFKKQWLQDRKYSILMKEFQKREIFIKIPNGKSVPYKYISNTKKNLFWQKVACLRKEDRNDRRLSIHA